MKNVKGQIRKVLNDKIVPAVAQEILYESETMMHEGMSVLIQGE